MIKKLNEITWGQFKIAGDGEFSITTTNSGVDGIRLKNQDKVKKILPYVTRTDTSNGIKDFVDNQNADFGLNLGKCITVGLDTQTAFWQPSNFITGQNIHVLENKNINALSAQFVIPMLRLQMKKLNWGGNGATLKRMKRMCIQLPTNDKGELDYDLMEGYVHSKQTVMVDRYRKYVHRKISELTFVSIPMLKQKKWESFVISDIFILKSGKRLESRNKIPGTRPFIGAADNNNGITGFVGNTNGSLDKNVLGVNYNGNGVCIGFYHPYECIFSDDVKRFHLKKYHDNEFVLLFMKVLILQQKGKFGYLYKFNSTRMEQTKIMLPVLQDNTPDYEYMEQYGKNVMLQKYRQYLKFLDKQSS